MRIICEETLVFPKNVTPQCPTQTILMKIEETKDAHRKWSVKKNKIDVTRIPASLQTAKSHTHGESHLKTLTGTELF